MLTAIIRKQWKSIRKVFRLIQKKSTRRKPRCIDRRFLSEWSSGQVRSSLESWFLSARTKREENDESATWATISSSKGPNPQERKKQRSTRRSLYTVSFLGQTELNAKCSIWAGLTQSAEMRISPNFENRSVSCLNVFSCHLDDSGTGRKNCDI